MTDGLFLSVCRDVAKSFPQVEFKEAIIDAACMDMVSKPQKYDVIVTMNLYGKQ